MARERETVMVGRVGRVLRTPGPGQAGSRGGEDSRRPAAFGDAGTAASGSGGETLNPGHLREDRGGPGAYSSSAARRGRARASAAGPPGRRACSATSRRRSRRSA